MPYADWSTDPAANTYVRGVYIGEMMSRNDVNNAMRGMMADLKDLNIGGGGGGGFRPILAFEGSITDGTTSNAAAFQAWLDAGGGVLNYQEEPYILDTSITVPDGCCVWVEQGVRVKWTGAAASGKTGIFQLGNNVFWGGFSWSATSASADLSRYVFEAAGKSNIEILNLTVSNMQHSYMRGAVDVYASTVTSGGGANVGRNIKIRGGGVRNSSALGGEGSVFILYCFDWSICDMDFQNAGIPIQCWGGDSNFGINGDKANERKCGNGLITDIRINLSGGTGQTGVFLSMCRDVNVSDCNGFNVNDVMYDPEGSLRITYSNCQGYNAQNGIFSTFFYAESVQFIGCKGVQPDGSKQMVYVNNSSISTDGCRDVSFIGCIFECQSGLSNIALETCAYIKFEGCTIRNCKIIAPLFNYFDVQIRNNDFIYDAVYSAFDAIHVNSTNPIDGGGGRNPIISIQNNTFSSKVQPAGSRGIYLYDSDFNAGPQIMVQNNFMRGFPISFRGRWATTNALSAFYLLSNNIFSGTIEKDDTGAVQASVMQKVNNYDLNGTLIP